jgi:nucleoside-diphosphate-sugar epimerase
LFPPKQRPTVLVIGGTGFIGQYLVRALVARGIAVRVVTRSMSSAPESCLRACPLNSCRAISLGHLL